MKITGIWFLVSRRHSAKLIPLFSPSIISRIRMSQLLGVFCNVFFNSAIEVYFRISQDSPMDAKISLIISDICVKKIGSSSQMTIWYIVKASYYSLFSSRQSVVVTAKKPPRTCTFSIPLYFSAIPLMILRP